MFHYNSFSLYYQNNQVYSVATFSLIYRNCGICIKFKVTNERDCMTIKMMNVRMMIMKTMQVILKTTVKVVIMPLTKKKIANKVVCLNMILFHVLNVITILSIGIC